MPLRLLIMCAELLMHVLTGSITTAAGYRACGDINVTSKHCVPSELCNEGLMINGNFYANRSRTLMDEQSCHYMEKCCDVNATLSQRTPAAYNDRTNFLQCGWHLDHWYYMRPWAHKQYEAKFAEFPWLVAIYGQHGYLCSGALITPFAVLTAGHCLQQQTAAQLQLVAGEWDAAVQLEPLPQQTRQVAELVLHANYTQAPAAHNVALLIATEGFQLAPHVQAICLPSPQLVYNYSQCYVAGWPRAHFGANETLPKRWPLSALPHEQCASKLRLAILGRRYALNETLLCAGGEKDDFVCGDMGAVPLMCPLPGCDDRYVVAGLLARPTRCDGPQLLGIYTNVKFYRKWIDQQLSQRHLDTRQYVL